MKAELKAKFLQYLNQNKQDEGFTLIELVMVILIIGILSAIALPTFLNRAAIARQTEAKLFVSAANRAQQAYRIEHISFAPDTTTLNIGLSTETVSYTYEIIISDTTKAFVKAKAKDGTLKSYAGGVVFMTSGVTLAAACQTTGVSSTPPNVQLSTIDGAKCESIENNME